MRQNFANAFAETHNLNLEVRHISYAFHNRRTFSLDSLKMKQTSESVQIIVRCKSVGM